MNEVEDSKSLAFIFVFTMNKTMSDQKNNILILSAGRRVDLVQAFQAEIKVREIASRLFATDINPQLSAACQIVDEAFKVPRATSPDYADHLLNLCNAKNIGLIVPTIDTELLSLAHCKEKFLQHGVHLVVSDKLLVRQCRDKRQTEKLFASLNIDVPRTFQSQEIEFPCFVKPFDGSRSVGAALLSSAADLTHGMLNDEKLMFMEYMDSSYSEFTVDVYFDRYGQLRCLVPRQRIEVRDGEVSKGITRKGYVYDYLINRLSQIRGACGCLTVQLFAKTEPMRYAALEINPRFGGGFPLSYAAGANFPGWLIDEYLLGKEIPFFDQWESNLLMLRYDAKIMVHDAV